MQLALLWTVVLNNPACELDIIKSKAPPAIVDLKLMYIQLLITWQLLVNYYFLIMPGTAISSRLARDLMTL
jgi:hypothetical protein